MSETFERSANLFDKTKRPRSVSGASATNITYPSVGIVVSTPSRSPVGQRAVIVLIRV